MLSIMLGPTPHLLHLPSGESFQSLKNLLTIVLDFFEQFPNHLKEVSFSLTFQLP